MVESRWLVKSFNFAVCVKMFIISVRRMVWRERALCAGLSGIEGHSPEWVPCSCP